MSHVRYTDVTNRSFHVYLFHFCVKQLHMFAVCTYTQRQSPCFICEISLRHHPLQMYFIQCHCIVCSLVLLFFVVKHIELVLVVTSHSLQHQAASSSFFPHTDA